MSRSLSSTFGETRDGHYHFGIDIKTNGTEGHSCYAVADGDIVRVRVSPYGYGKALYLQLADGRT
ncbi:M23 family peptidase, partial [bacterium]|nr:M23 family peptidase [bacterium]